MQDMIEKIIDMDEKAREITEKAQKYKVNSAQEIAKKREEIREKFLSRARKRISINKERELKIANEKKKQMEQQNIKRSKALKAAYEENCDKWVSQIVDRVIRE